MIMNFAKFIIICLSVKFFIVFSNPEVSSNKKLVVKLINLDKRKDKWENVKNLWSEHFKLERVSAITHPRDPVCGLALTHISLMREFLMNKEQDYLLIMEDDAHPTPDFNVTFFKGVLDHAMRIPFWHVINFGPWFSRQPIVQQVDEYLVAIDYFHTTHFMGYHRRVLEKYLTTYAGVIEQGYCLAVDNYFGNYGNPKSQSLILASSKLMAIQNHHGVSDIGGGPEMDACAINAALAGRMVKVEIVSGPSADIAPTFEPPIYGYKVISSSNKSKRRHQSGSDGGESPRVVWSRQCNLLSDEVDEANIVEDDPKESDEEEGQVTSSSASSGSGSGSVSGSKSKKKKGRKKKTKKAKSSSSSRTSGMTSSSPDGNGDEELL